SHRDVGAEALDELLGIVAPEKILAGDVAIRLGIDTAPDGPVENFGVAEKALGAGRDHEQAHRERHMLPCHVQVSHWVTRSGERAARRTGVERRTGSYRRTR